jgi:ParB family transcriptional regulator, chromosome partitioning protein
MSKSALGRGLGALLGTAPARAVAPAAPAPPAPTATVVAPKPTAAPANPFAAPSPAVPTPTSDTRDRVLRVKLEKIRPSPMQPRKEFSPEALQELADSIKEQGIIQPLIVRDRQTHYELIAGERRWRASQLLNLAEVPVIVREADDRAVLELALIENLQRENLNPMEEALGYAQLIGQFALRQEDVGLKVGKSRVAVANSLRLLKLAPDVQVLVRDGKLSVGHAKVILGLPHAAQQKLAVERAMKDGLTVRQTEELVSRLLNQPNITPGKASHGVTITSRDAHVVAVENKVREKFGTKVQLRYRAGKGSLEVKFFNDADLERILSVIGVKVD